MPRIPEYQRSNIQSEAGPNIQAPQTPGIEAFGGGQALGGLQGAERALGAATNVIEEQKKAADDTLTMNAYGQALQAKNLATYDTQKGVMSLRGAKALDGAQGVRDGLNEKLSEIEGGLQNSDQRALFARMRQRVTEDFNGTLERHVYDQAQKFDQESTQALMTTAIDDAVLNNFIPGKVQEQMALVKGLARKQAVSQGYDSDPTILALKEKEAGSKLASSVLDRMLATNDPKAQGFYLGIQGELTSADRERLDKTMKVATTREEATRTADQIQNAHSDLGAALRAARELPPGEVRDQTISRIKDYHADLKLADVERDRVRYEGAADLIQKSGGQAELTPQMLAGLSPTQIKSLQDFRRQQKTGETAEVNSDEYLRLLKLSAEDPAAFKEEKIGEKRHLVAPSQLTELAKMQGATRSGQSTVEQTNARVAVGVIRGNLSQMGLTRKDNGEQVKEYEDEVLRQATIQSKQLKRALTREELLNIADPLAMTVKVKGSWFGGSTPLYRAKQGAEFNDVTVDDVPPGVLKRIREAIVLEGRTPSDDLILLKYRAKLGQIRAR